MGLLKDDTPIFEHSVTVYELKEVLNIMPDDAFILLNRFNTMPVEDVNRKYIGHIDLLTYPINYVKKEKDNADKENIDTTS